MKRAMIIGIILTILMSFGVFGELVISNPPSLNVQPILNADNLLVELEVKDASTPEFWMDVYLTSATHTQFFTNKITLVISDPNDAARFVADAPLTSGFSKFLWIGSSSPSLIVILNKVNTDPIPIIPGVKTYLGSVRMTHKNALMSGTNSISLGSSTIWYATPASENLYSPTLVANSFCIPKLECSPSEVCGAADDGCGGLINCGVCGPGLGQVCVNNACVSAVLGLTPTDELFCKTTASFSSTDKTLLQAVVNAINDNLDDKVNIVLDIFTALNAWFTAR